MCGLSIVGEKKGAQSAHSHLSVSSGFIVLIPASVCFCVFLFFFRYCCCLRLVPVESKQSAEGGGTNAQRTEIFLFQGARVARLLSLESEHVKKGSEYLF